MSEAELAPEFSRIVTIDSLGDRGRTLVLEADAAEREAIRKRLGLEGLSSLSGTAEVRRAGRERFRVDIDFRADVLQSCVVTLEPVSSLVSDTGVIWFQRVRGPVEEPDFVDLDAPDPPEPLVDDRIDVGELVVQHLALALDPYPRAEGAKLEEVLPAGEEVDEDVDVSEADNAFAALVRLKKR